MQARQLVPADIDGMFAILLKHLCDHLTRNSWVRWQAAGPRAAATSRRRHTRRIAGSSRLSCSWCVPGNEAAEQAVATSHGHVAYW